MGHRWFFLFVATVLLTGCSGDSSNSGSQPVNSAAFLTDVGEQAIGSSGTPGDRPGAQGVETGDAITTEADAGTAVNFGCEGNEDCGPGEVCDCAKACVPEGFLPCEEDKNCGSGSYCDGCTGMCYALKQLCEPCGLDGECEGNGTKCLSLLSGAQVCGLACLSDAGCPKGFTCEAIPGLETNQCLPIAGSCDAPTECAGDEDCSVTLICSDEGLCVQGCPDDDSCPDGKVCEAGRCIESCEGNVAAVCPEGKICVEGHCTVEGGCVTSADCPEPETYCDLDQDLCVAGCQVDADCKSSGLQCDSGSCVPKGCTGNFFCAFGEVCNLSSGICELSTQPHCEECDPNGGGVCTEEGSSNQCLTFADENGNEKGSFCLVSCGSDPDNPCPQGYSCEDVEVEEGVSTPLCVRDCSIPPV